MYSRPSYKEGPRNKKRHLLFFSVISLCQEKNLCKICKIHQKSPPHLMQPLILRTESNQLELALDYPYPIMKIRILGYQL